MTPPPPLARSDRPILSLCIADLQPRAFIGETVQAIVSQLPAVGVELVVVDGASPDNTAEVMARFADRYPAIRYFRETGIGLDRDFDKAVGYARGDHCWLMSDDDLLVPGA